MKNSKKILFSSFIALAAFGCKKKDTTSAPAGTCSTVCSYTLASGETAATASSGLEGTHNLTYCCAQTGSPFTVGVKGKFTISGNTLTVEIEGKECITLKNPRNTGPGTDEIKFIDNCRDNLSYDVSKTASGALNEINISSVSGTWLGQFNNH
jgi:hypothetical protein